MPDAPTLTPKMTTWGKLNSKQSYAILAQDLDRALAFAEFSKRETQFLQQVREACWAEAIRLGKKRGESWPEANGCQVNLSDLERQTGIDRQQWGRARKSLIQSHVLTEDRDGTLRINKQADEWIVPSTGLPRLSVQLIDFCRSVQPGTPAARQTSFPFTQRKVNPRSPHLATVMTGLADLDAPQQDCCTPRADSDAPPASKSAQSGPVAYRNGREEEIFQTSEDKTATVPAAVGFAAPGGVIQPPPSISQAPPGPGANSAAAIELERWAAQFGAEVGQLARAYCDLLSAEWIRLVIQRELFGRRKRPDRIAAGIIARLLCSCMETGIGPTQVAASRPASTSSCSAPTVRYFQVDPAQRRSIPTPEEQDRLLAEFASPDYVPLSRRLQLGLAN